MVERGNATKLLKLNSRLFAHDAEMLNERFQNLEGQNLAVDSSEVEVLSTPCVQVMLAAARTWKKSGHTLDILDPSEAFIKALSRLYVNINNLRVTGIKT